MMSGKLLSASTSIVKPKYESISPISLSQQTLKKMNLDTKINQKHPPQFFRLTLGYNIRLYLT